MKSFFLKLPLLIAVALPALEAEAADEFGGATIYGYITSGTAGIYEVLPDNVELKFTDSGYASDRVFTAMSAGWINDGKLCGYAPDVYSSTVYDNYYIEFDWESGQQLLSKSISTSAAIQYGALDTSDRTVYGFGISGGKKSWLSTSLDNPESITTIADVADEEWCLGMTYNYDDFYLTGIRKDGTIVKISKDGTQQTVCTTGLKIESTTAGMVYTGGQVYLSFMGNDWEYHLYVVNLETGSSKIFPLFPDKQCRFMILGEAAVSTDAPDAPVINSLEFPWGSADGKASLTLPDATIDGQALTGELEWYAEVDGTSTASGKATPGTTIEIEFTEIPSGSHIFSFYTISDELKGRSAEQTLYIGHDTPMAPENVTLTETSVKWDAVTTGVHGGYVDSDAIVYTVYLNGDLIGTTAETTMALPENDDTTLRLITATVTATAGEFTSAPGTSESLLIGEALELPLFMAPTASDFEICSTLDKDADGKTWTYNEGEEAFYSGYNPRSPLNDWLILPPVNLEVDNVYYFSMQVRRMRSYFDQEALEVYIGAEPTPEAMMKHQIVNKFQPDVSYTDYLANVQVPADGKWYIGLRCVSDADQSGIFVKNIALAANGVTAASPEAVTKLSAVPADNGTLEATIHFTFPEKTIGGETLDPNTELTAIVKAESEVSVSGLPGSSASATVATAQGNNIITVTPMLGEINGLAKSVEVYTGVKAPGTVTGIGTVISEDMKSVTLSWEAPQPEEDNYFRPEELTYSVYQMKSTMLGDMWDLVAEGINDLSYTFTTDDPIQECYELGIVAANIAGECADKQSAIAVLGTPWNLPMDDTFDTNTIYSFEPWVIYSPTEEYHTQWGPLPKSVLPFINDDDKEGNAICGMGLEEDCMGRAGFPIFSTLDCNNGAAIRATFWTGQSASPDIRLLGFSFGMEETVEVGKVTSNGDWNTLTFSLPDELLGKEWVALYIDASFPLGTSQWVVMDDYSISPLTSADRVESEAVTISTGRGMLTIVSSAQAKYMVVSVDGSCVANGVISGGTSETLYLSSGLYIVNINGNSHKVIVK